MQPNDHFHIGMSKTYKIIYFSNALKVIVGLFPDLNKFMTST